MTAGIGTNAARRVAGTVLLGALAGCAAGGPPGVREPAVATVTAAPIAPIAPAAPAAAPTPASSAAELTRWCAGLYRQARHDEAIALLSPWLAAHPGPEPEVRAALAIHQEAAGQPEAAKATLADGPVAAPATARARTWLGLRGDDFGAVLEDARRAVAAAPRSAPDRNNLGIALLYAGRPREAREEFLAARELDPELPGALYNLAIVESVYFFDDAAARRWLAAYRRLDAADPDGLFATLGGELSVATEAVAPEVLP